MRCPNPVSRVNEPAAVSTAVTCHGGDRFLDKAIHSLYAGWGRICIYIII